MESPHNASVGWLYWAEEGFSDGLDFDGSDGKEKEPTKFRGRLSKHLLFPATAYLSDRSDLHTVVTCH